MFLIFRSSSNIGMVFCPASSGGQLRPILLLFCVLHACNKGVCLLSVNIKQVIGPPYTETKQKHRNLPTKMSKKLILFFFKAIFYFCLESIWKTDLDWLVPNNDRLIVLSFFTGGSTVALHAEVRSNVSLGLQYI